MAHTPCTHLDLKTMTRFCPVCYSIPMPKSVGPAPSYTSFIKPFNLSKVKLNVNLSKVKLNVDSKSGQSLDLGSGLA